MSGEAGCHLPVMGDFARRPSYGVMEQLEKLNVEERLLPGGMW
jgi:hypothetical protein